MIARSVTLGEMISPGRNKTTTTETSMEAQCSIIGGEGGHVVIGDTGGAKFYICNVVAVRKKDNQDRAFMTPSCAKD